MLTYFLLSWLALFGAMVTVYFVTGTVLAALTARHPCRRIQPQRHEQGRLRQEILASMRALLASAGLLAGGWVARREGWTMPPLETSWWSLLLMFLVAMALFDAWFYFGHRLLHTRAFFRFHALHHRSMTPSAWSNDSSTVMDTLIEHSFYLVVWFVLPIPAAAVFALRLFDQVSGMIGHSGFEFFASAGARWPSPFICTTFHDLHHSRFHYNFANMFSVWDRLLGTLDPDYDRMVARMEQGATPAEATRRG